MARYQSQLTGYQPIASTEPQMFQSLAARLSAFASKQEDELDRQMAKKAKERGLIDAQGKTSITLRDGNTIADEAWNEGAIASHLSAVKLDLTENLTRIEAESPRNPIAYKEKAKAYSAGLLEGLDPRMRPAVQDEVASHVMKTTFKLQSDLQTFQREQHAAEVTTAIDLYRTQSMNQARDGDLEGATESQFRAIELTNSLENSGMLDPKLAEKQRRDITREAEDSAIYGEFGRQLESGDAMSFLQKFSKVKSLGDRDPEYRQKMTDKMLGMMKDRHAAADAQLAHEEKLRKEVWRKGEKKIVELDLAGQLVPAHLEEMVSNGEIDPKTAAKYKANAFRGGPEFSDGWRVLQYRTDLLSFNETDIMADTDLSRPDKEALIEQRRKLEADAGNWRGTQNGREGARRINAAFGIRDGLMVRPSKDDIRRADQVLTRYFNEVELLPLEEREAGSVDIANKLIKEVDGEINESKLEEARERLNRRPYRTHEEIDAANLGAEETNIAKKQLDRILKQIQRLESKSE